MSCGAAASALEQVTNPAVKVSDIIRRDGNEYLWRLAFDDELLAHPLMIRDRLGRSNAPLKVAIGGAMLFRI